LVLTSFNRKEKKGGKKDNTYFPSAFLILNIQSLLYDFGHLQPETHTHKITRVQKLFGGCNLYEIIWMLIQL